MTARKVETQPSHLGVYTVESVANLPPAPEALDLPYCPVHYRWTKAKRLTMALLRIVDKWVHKSRPLCCRR